MAATGPARVNKQAWLICSVAVFFLAAGYLRDWPITMRTRVFALPFVLLGAAGIGWIIQFLWVLSGGIRARSSVRTKRRVLIAVVLAGLGCTGVYLGRTMILRQYDQVRLAMFSRRIAESDRVIGTWAASDVQLTFSGDDVKKIVAATASGVSASMPDGEFMVAPGGKATFYRGTNVLGWIHVHGELFAIGPGGPRFFDTSGLLRSTVYTPLLDAVRLEGVHER